jgi:tryptophan synthase alpha subunit
MNMVTDLGVNLVLAYDTPFGEADELLKAAEREDVKVLLHVTELGEALFPAEGPGGRG